MRRKGKQLLPLERALLDAILRLWAEGASDAIHGYRLAKEISSGAEARHLAAAGTIYRRLDRLEDLGLIDGEWEPFTDERRPRRKLYRITERGKEALDSDQVSETISETITPKSRPALP